MFHHRLLISLVVSYVSTCAVSALDRIAFVNEFRYGRDAFVEIASIGKQKHEGDWYEVILYSGEDGFVYDRHEVGMGAGSTDEHVSLAVLEGIDLRDGTEQEPYGLALVDKEEGIVLQFLSYSGRMVAMDGPAKGLRSIDVEVDESKWEGSIQLGGRGCDSRDFIWMDGAVPTPGRINPHQSFTTCN
jgi:hypothetical protein